MRPASWIASVRLILDSGPWCVGSCGPFRLHTHTLRHTHTSPLWYKPSMSDSPPASLRSSVFSLPSVFLLWPFDSFNTSLSFSVACLAQRIVHTPSALTVNAVLAREMRLKQKKKKKKNQDPCHLMCPAVTPSCPHFFPRPTLIFSRCASVNRTSGSDYWEWTLKLCKWRLCICECVCQQ